VRDLTYEYWADQADADGDQVEEYVTSEVAGGTVVRAEPRTAALARQQRSRS
jgi:hypothetical protein